MTLKNNFSKTLKWIFIILVVSSCVQKTEPTRTAVQDAMVELPVGSTTPLGWIKDHIIEDYENGWITNVEKMSAEGDWWQRPGRIELLGDYGKSPFYQPYVEHLGAHAGGEYQAHWIDNLCRLGWDCGMEECRTKASEAVSAILEHIPENGYIGVASSEMQFTNVSLAFSEYELWSFGEHLYALMTYYQRTGERDVLDACIKAADLFVDTFDPGREGHTELYGLWWATVIYSLSELHGYTGNDRYLAMAEYMMPTFMKALKWDTPTVEQHGVSGHSAGLGVALKAELALYHRNGDPALLENINLIEEQVHTTHLLPNGSPSGHGESLRGKGPYVHMELCDPFWWVWHWTEMLKLTGDPRYADMAEKAAFNALPAARSKDGKTIQYFSCQNQITTSKHVDQEKTAHRIRHAWDCCHSNSSRILPIMAANSVLKGEDGAVNMVYYGPFKSSFELKGASVRLTNRTNYPFEEITSVLINTDRPVKFPLRLRVPGWCREAMAKVGDKTYMCEESSKGWIEIERRWSDGDVVELSLPMEIKVEKHRFNSDIRLVPDQQLDGEWAEAVTVERGPLLYSLSVPEEIRKPVTIMGKERGGFECMAAVDGPWNYALLLDKEDPAYSFTIVSNLQQDTGFVWENPPVTLQVKAARVPEWRCTDQQLSGIVPAEEFDRWSEEKRHRMHDRRWLAPDLPTPGFEIAEETETLTLIPHGFTLLRMTYLPWVDME
ncbi:MAG: beta-L-arabinofuranosidase domain-containing protein [Bacteroidota bacterium]